MLAQIPKAQKMALVNDYFALIHDRPHSLFHRTTFLDDLEANRIDKSLVLSMCALSSYLSTEESVRRYGPEMAHLSKTLLLANIGTPEISHVQTAILLANVFAAERDPQAEAMFFAIASRMAQILRLHEVDDNDEPVMQQVKCRIWWTLVMADYWSSAGLMIQRQLEYQRCNLPLPGPEDLFQDASPHQSVLEMSSPGLWAHMIDLVRIFGRIQDLHQSLVIETSSNADLDLQVENLARQLEGWTSMLPPDKILNEENLLHHIDRGLGGPYVALHLGFHHYFTLLFFHSLDSSQPYTPSEPAFIHRCRAHALSFSRLLLTSRETRGCEANYATVGHMTVVSSSVLLHMLLFGNDSELVAAKAALMGNFAVLTELNKYWPSVGVAVRFAFHSTALRSKLTDYLTDATPTHLPRRVPTI